jgi:hypothetical protein
VILRVVVCPAIAIAKLGLVLVDRPETIESGLALVPEARGLGREVLAQLAA